MAKGWFVLHAYSGHENKVKKQIDLLKEVHKDAIFEVKVPSEEVVEIKDGKRRVTSRKFLPGYVLVEMDLPDRGWKEVCGDIRKVAGVTGFVGTSRTQRPQPISARRGQGDPAEGGRDQGRQDAQAQARSRRARRCGSWTDRSTRSPATSRT